jgi:hypothetical protein
MAIETGNNLCEIETYETCLQVGTKLARRQFVANSWEDSNLVAIT